jgi:hypothetical protein
MSECSCKITRQIREYDIGPDVDSSIAEANDYLADLWTGSDGENHSVRDIMDWFNQQILRSFYREQGRDISTDRIEYDHEILTGDDDTATATLAQDLAQDGIEIEAIRDAMVGSSTLYRHLTDCLSVEKESWAATESLAENRLDRVQYLKSSLANQVTEVLELLEEDDILASGSDSGVEIDIRVTCPECGVACDLQTALQRGYICSEHVPGSDDRGGVDVDLVDILD